MLWLWIGIALLAVILITLAIAFYCYKRIFYSKERIPLKEDEFELPEGEIYEVFRKEMIDWVKMSRSMPHEDVSVTSFDGLTLRGKYYECQKGAPIELLFHGYRGNSERDLSGGIERCFALQRNALIIDQRASGRSDGNVITFGIKERLDCLKWIEFAIEKFGKDSKIILTGISMGAATVMMAAGEKLPKNVVCVLADCGYTSPKEIIEKVIRDMKLPAGLVMPFVKLGARVFGHFNLVETSPMEAVKRTNIPIIFIHGKSDDFIPWQMSQRLHDNCNSTKSFTTIPGAGHGLAYPVNKEAYLQALRDFEKEWKV